MPVLADPLGPGIDLVPIVPDDGADLPEPARAIRCRPDSTGGTIRVTTVNGEVRNTNISADSYLLVGVIRVHATGTVANLLEAVV